MEVGASRLLRARSDAAVRACRCGHSTQLCGHLTGMLDIVIIRRIGAKSGLLSSGRTDLPVQSRSHYSFLLCYRRRVNDCGTDRVQACYRSEPLVEYGGVRLSCAASLLS
jgi:hypothetical protein